VRMEVQAERSKVVENISIMDFVYNNREKEEEVVEEMDGGFIREREVREENKNVGIHLKFLDIPIHFSKFLGPACSVDSVDFNNI